ncbi:MAG: Uncharacterised protein [Porticoccaceae bacterium UBA1117]|jgi:hypothetical protein|nr:MAG: Uncharacterised protein [Porticoccaceae bacterium UBA1117]|tara:strand:+ start:250 stop:441 length:192 start_codon:yes stop_codon:yes gene_type:complete
MYTFILLVYLGVSRELISNDMVFTNIEICNYYAKEIVKRYSTHGIGIKDRVIAYCIPDNKTIK